MAKKKKAQRKIAKKIGRISSSKKASTIKKKAAAAPKTGTKNASLIVTSDLKEKLAAKAKENGQPTWKSFATSQLEKAVTPAA